MPYIHQNELLGMTMLVSHNPLLGKMQKYLKSLGVESEIPDSKLDFEYDYLDSDYIGHEDGTCSVGVLHLKDSFIDYVHIIKKQKFEKCDFANGGFAGMGLHLHAWYKIRYFLSFDDFLNVGPIRIGTVTTISKSLFKSKVDEFFWNGYPKLTTLPPGLIRDNLVEKLDSDQLLKRQLIANLLKERVIKISRYSPPEKACQRNAKVSKAAIVMESSWKLYNDLFAKNDTFAMYENMADVIKRAIEEVKYHLRQ